MRRLRLNWTLRLELEKHLEEAKKDVGHKMWKSNRILYPMV